uniref:Hoc-like head decoration n=1 Tax=Salmonella phage pJS4 TaxID=3141578 RepID=A0AAU7E477_9VIRU
MGFFKVRDIPARRVVQYSRVSGSAEKVVYIEDESVLGSPVDEMPYADKTGIAVESGGALYEVPYLEDVGDVYFAVQPEDAQLGSTATTLTATPKAGKAPYTVQWYKDDKQVVNVPDGGEKLKVTEAGKYWAVVTDADGKQAVSKAAEVKPKAE